MLLTLQVSCNLQSAVRPSLNGMPRQASYDMHYHRNCIFETRNSLIDLRQVHRNRHHFPRTGITFAQEAPTNPDSPAVAGAPSQMTKFQTLFYQPLRKQGYAYQADFDCINHLINSKSHKVKPCGRTIIAQPQFNIFPMHKVPIHG